MTKKKLGSIAIIIFFVTAIAVSLLSLVSLSDHSCAGAHCELCLSLAGAKEFLRDIAGIFVISSLVSLLADAKAPTTTLSVGVTDLADPVSLKVRLLC